MASRTLTTDPSAMMWQQLVEFRGLAPSAARALLKLQFSERDHARMAELGSKARAGTLTPPEQEQLDTFERISCLLGILHSKARQVLKKPKKAS